MNASFIFILNINALIAFFASILGIAVFYKKFPEEWKESLSQNRKREYISVIAKNLLALTGIYFLLKIFIAGGSKTFIGEAVSLFFTAYIVGGYGAFCLSKGMFNIFRLSKVT